MLVVLQIRVRDDAFFCFARDAQGGKLFLAIDRDGMGCRNRPLRRPRVFIDSLPSEVPADRISGLGRASEPPWLVAGRRKTPQNFMGGGA